MTPPQLHIHVEDAFSAGYLPIITVGDPGAHGEDITGMQGIGVSTPKAADVAAATCGFVIVLHIPKGIMFRIGMLSMIVAAGILEARTLLVGMTFKVDGAIPKGHFNVAPKTTS